MDELRALLTDVRSGLEDVRAIASLYIGAINTALGAQCDGQTTKIEPGSPMHFALLGAPYGFNLLTGKDWQDVQAFARDVWAAALAQHGQPRGATMDESQRELPIIGYMDRRYGFWHSSVHADDIALTDHAKATAIIAELWARLVAASENRAASPRATGGSTSG